MDIVACFAWFVLVINALIVDRIRTRTSYKNDVSPDIPYINLFMNYQLLQDRLCFRVFINDE